MLFNQPDPPACETDKILPSPNGHYLAIQYNCHDNQFTRLLNLAASPLFTDLPLSSSSITAVPTPALPDSLLPRGYFLDWSPDGNWLLFRHTDTDQVSLLAADGSSQIPLTALPVGTYRATFTPDGQSLTIGATRGLGFGSEIGTLNLLDGNYTQLRQFPNQIVAYPVWSPDGSQLAYILMPDSNIPFTVGELWLADSTTGEPLTLLGEVDAGHGYAPVWSPDGSTIAYVYRENPHSIRANQMTHELHSNIYRVELSTGIITPLTQFNETLVYGPTWSPDSQQLLFTANDAIWLLDVIHGETPIQINRTDTARHPAWLVLSTP